MLELKADDILCNFKNPSFHLKRAQLPIKIRIYVHAHALTGELGRMKIS